MSFGIDRRYFSSITADHLLLCLKSLLTIYEENIKKSHKRVVFLYVIKTRSLSSSNFLGLENINFQTFFVN